MRRDNKLLNNLSTVDDTADRWFLAARISITMTSVCWLIELVNGSVGHGFSIFGILPRHLDSLPGVFIWPFLHGGAGHLLMNSTPLLVLGFFVALRGMGTFMLASLLITLLAGVAVWLFGRSAYHIGASGLVFGYFGFLVALGWYERRLSTLLVAAGISFYYGGMLWGVVPSDSFISWEAHLFGLLAGIVAARVLAMRPED